MSCDIVEVLGSIFREMPNLAGAYVLAAVFASILFGVMCVQLYLYHTAFSQKDPRWLQGLVWVIFAIELAFQIIGTEFAWSALGAGWGNPTRLLVHPPAAVSAPLLTGIVTLLVQGFYTWRIVVLGERWDRVQAAVIVMLSIGQLVMTAYLVALIYQQGTSCTVVVLSHIKKIITSWLILAATGDIMISISLFLLLRRASKLTTNSDTATILQKVMTYTVETGLLTSFCAIADLVVFLVLPHTNWHIVIFFSLSKIYFNTLLATLNSRMTLTILGTRSSAREDASTRAFSSAVEWRDNGNAASIISTRPSVNTGLSGLQFSKTPLVLEEGMDDALELKGIRAGQSSSGSASQRNQSEDVQWRDLPQ